MSIFHSLNTAPHGLIGNDTMEHLNPLLNWLQTTWLNHLALDFSATWPTCEIIHYVGLSMLLGAIFVMDLRLIGVQHPVISSLSIHRMLPLAFTGFGLNLLTGIVFICGDPHRYANNISFQIKAILILLAGLNALLYSIKIAPKLAAAAPHSDPPIQAKLVGSASIALWLGVLIFGRLIPYLGTG